MQRLPYRRSSGSDDGAAAVEFALIMIPLLLIIMGIIDFGRILYCQELLNMAAREGARMGATSILPTGATVGNVKSKVSTVMVAYPSISMTGTNPVTTVTVSPPTGLTDSSVPCLNASSVEVRIVGQFHWMTPIGWMPGVGGDRTVSAWTTMACG